MAKPARIVLIVLFNVVLTLILLEVGIRIWGYSEHYLSDPIYMSVTHPEEIPFIHKPNLQGARARGLAIINTDSLGLRSVSSGETYGPKSVNEFRIAIAGDSCTFGEGVRQAQDTFAQRLQDILNQKQSANPVKVFNFGVSGYSVKEMAATLKYRMPAVEPDLVLMAIIPDDFNLARTPSVDEWGYSANRTLSGFVPKNSKIKRLLRDVHLVYVLRDLRYQLLASRHSSQNPVPVAETPESYRYVTEFKQLAEQRHTSYAIVLLPVVRRGFSDVVREQLRRDAVTVVDLTALVQEFTPEQFMASRFDAHPSAEVHSRMAEQLSEYVLKNYLEKR